jgi:hypothetical protein
MNFDAWIACCADKLVNIGDVFDTPVWAPEEPIVKYA